MRTNCFRYGLLFIFFIGGSDEKYHHPTYLFSHQQNRGTNQPHQQNQNRPQPNQGGPPQNGPPSNGPNGQNPSEMPPWMRNQPQSMKQSEPNQPMPPQNRPRDSDFPSTGPPAGFSSRPMSRFDQPGSNQSGPPGGMSPNQGHQGMNPAQRGPPNGMPQNMNQGNMNQSNQPPRGYNQPMPMGQRGPVNPPQNSRFGQGPPQSQGQPQNSGGKFWNASSGQNDMNDTNW